MIPFYLVGLNRIDRRKLNKPRKSYWLDGSKDSRPTVATCPLGVFSFAFADLLLLLKVNQRAHLTFRLTQCQGQGQFQFFFSSYSSWLCKEFDLCLVTSQ